MGQKRLGLPKVMTLTRSSKEVPLNNQKGIADVLNYSLEELKQGVGCNLSGATGNFSLCFGMLNFINRRLEQYGTETEGFVSPMSVSISLILTKAANMWSQNKRTTGDVAKMQSLLQELTFFQTNFHPEVTLLATNIAMAITSCLNRHPA